MKSPSTQYYAAPHTQLVDRATDPTPPRDDAVNTIARLPLRAQAAFRRQLLVLLALQVVAVGAAVAAVDFACNERTRHWITSHLVDDTRALILLGASTLLLLLLLAAVRDVAPYDWLVLLCFSVAQALCLVVAELALGSYAILLNWGFAWVCVTLTAALAGWTHETGRGDKRCGFAWLPAEYDAYNEDDIRGSRTLWPAYATYGLAFMLTSGVAALVFEYSGVVDSWREWTFEGLAISCCAQLLLGLWVVYEVERLPLMMTADAAMGGVHVLVHVYADLVAAVVAVAILAASCLCIAATEGGSGIAGGALELGADGCCACLEIVAHKNPNAVVDGLEDA